MTEQKQQDYKSEEVTFTLSRKENCIVEYKIKASPKLVVQAQKHALRILAKDVSLPGFRKGKAPDHLIAKKYPGPLDEQWKKSVADLAFQECQKTAPTPLLEHDTQIQFNVEKKSVEEGAEITLSFETEPEVPEIAFDKVAITEVPVEAVDKKKVDETIEQIRQFFTEWETISDRPVKESDHVVIDVEITETTPPQKALSEARFEVSKEKNMATWMYDLVMGMKVGESKDGISQPDADASEETKKETPPKKVKVTLLRIEKAKLPAIDDELAKKVGVSTAKEMREKLEALLKKQAEDHVKKNYRDQVNEYLVETYPFELPKTILQRETQFRIKQLVSDPQFQMKLVKMSEEEKKQTLTDIEKMGEKAVRLFYISRKIIKDEKIQITPKEVNQEVKTPLEAMFSEQTDIYNPNEDSQEQKAIAMSRIMLTKAEDFLISKAKIQPKPKDTPKKKTPKKETKGTGEKKAAPKKSTAKKTAPKKTAAKKAAPKKKEK